MITVLSLSFRLLSLSGIDRKRTSQCFLNQFFTSKSLKVVMLPKNTSHSNVSLLLLLLLRILRSNSTKIHHSLGRHSLSWHRHSWRLCSSHWLVGHHKHLAWSCSYNWGPACDWRCWTRGRWRRRGGSLLTLVATLLATADNSHLKIGPQRSIEGLVLLNVVRGLPHRLQHR